MPRLFSRRSAGLALSAASVLVALGAALAPAPAAAQTDTPIKFVLDWKLQGVHAWYYLAQDRGYFAREKLAVTIDQGDGSAATVTKIMAGAYQAGFGDVNAIVQNATAKPGQAPVMVYMLYNRAPFALIAKADGPVRTPQDLQGRTVGTPAGGAAARMSPSSRRAPASMPPRSPGPMWRPTCRSSCCSRAMWMPRPCSRSPAT